jgi:hypothetical protein
MKLPSIPRRGEDIAAKVEQIINFIRASRVTSVVGGTIRETPNGSVITVKPGKASKGVPETCGAFKIEQGEEPNELTVTQSTIIGETPAGFTEGKKTFVIATVSGVIYGKIEIDNEGDASNAQVLDAEDLPADTDTTYHIEIGRYTVEGTGEEAVINFTQVKCGPLTADVCRNWFTSEAPYYGVTWR